MAMTATQFNRNCQSFINLIEKRDHYDNVKQLLNEWKQQNKPAIGAIDTFMKMAKLFQDDQDLVQEFNKCLAKEASILKKPTTNFTNLEVKQLAMQNQKSSMLLDTVFNWIKTDQKEKTPVIVQPAPLPIISPTTLQQLSQQQLVARLEANPFSRQVAKILALYRRCIITLKEFKSLIEPKYFTDPSSFNMLFQYAEELENTRRKITIFAPLTDLVDSKYPVQQVGNSYIIIPDGYSNYSKRWVTNLCEKFLNRICCSVPLGSEGSFVIARKNQFEEQLFKNEEEKYQIDQNICTIKGAISRIQKNKNLNSPLFQKILTKIYPYENVFNIMISQPQIAKNVILPRLYQKMQELYKCKEKFNRTCEEVSNKNFIKSLDYRCFYFRKNDKKFNSTQRWQKEIELRKAQISLKIEEFDDQITDRQALQHPRSHVLNTFDNITKQQLFDDKKVDIQVYDKKVNAFYPPYPHNQILFIMSFENQEIFNDVLEIILYHCQKKAIFELIVLKLFKRQIHRRLYKDPSILAYLQAKMGSNNGISQSQPNFSNENNENSNTNNIMFGSANGANSESLNEPRKDRKVYKDITEQFNDLIEEEIQPLPLEEFENPFEGPNNHTFICTKVLYNFVRYLLTIYQRFLKANELSNQKRNVIGVQKKDVDEGAEPSLYAQFLAIMIYKVKDPKQNFEEYLRRITNQEAFIYFTLDKFIQSTAKLINNINSDSLTYKILKDQTKDYENELKKWAEFNFPSINHQLTRVYRQNESLFRFTYTPSHLLFISMWDNSCSQKQKTKKQAQQNDDMGIILNYLTEPSVNKKDLKQQKAIKKSTQSHLKHKAIKQSSPKLLINENSEYLSLSEGIMLMKGEQCMLQVKRERSNSKIAEIQKEFDRLRKFVKRV